VEIRAGWGEVLRIFWVKMVAGGTSTCILPEWFEIRTAKLLSCQYVPIIVKALRFSYEQKTDRALREDEGLCYREQFSEDMKKRFARIFERLLLESNR
jgi:hypothetical protein